MIKAGIVSKITTNILSVGDRVVEEEEFKKKTKLKITKTKEKQKDRRKEYI